MCKLPSAVGEESSKIKLSVSGNSGLRVWDLKLIAVIAVTLTIVKSNALAPHLIAKDHRHEDAYIHRFSDGSQIELIAISDSKFVRSWRPDGSPITISKSRIDRASEWMGDGTFVLLRLHLTHPSTCALSPYPLIETDPNGGEIVNVPCMPNEFECVRRMVDPAGHRGPIQIFCALDEFKTRATTSYKNLKKVDGTGFGDVIKLQTHVLVVPKGGKEHHEDEGFRVDFDSNLVDGNKENHVIAVAKNGKVFPGDPWTKGQNYISFTDDHHGPPFQQIDARNVAKLSLMTRPISSFSFKNVVLKRQMGSS